MRQSEDMDFNQVTNHLVDGEMTENDIEILQDLETDAINIDLQTTALYYKNKDSDIHNDLIIAKFFPDHITVTAEIK